MKKIIFYAPLGKGIPPENIGGAEVGCLKTKAIYEKADYKVIVIHKPAITRGKLQFMLKMAFVPVHLLFVLLFTSRSMPLHIVGFYTKIVAFECLLMRIAHLCRHKVIYELRNGSMVHTYEEGNTKYRKRLKTLLIKSDVVLCQGMEYIDFIKKQWNIERDFYPNYIMDDFIQPNNLERPKPIRMIYFGRVTESKNVDVVIETLALVRKAGYEATLDVIGAYSQDYKTVLEEKMNSNLVADYVTFHGRKDFSYIADKLRVAHYFVFPSTEKQEGHSNSLTEAMGCGVVPIASTAGFNRSICGNENLIVEEVKAELFANKIIHIEKEEKWKEYSSFVYERILNNYTQNIVSKNLIRVTDSLYPSSL